MLQLDHDLDDVQSAVVQVAREYFDRDIDGFRFPENDCQAIGYDDGQWQTWRELDWHRILVDEARGGAGLGVRELSLLCRQAGVALAPTPYLFASLATWLVARSDSDSDIGGALFDGGQRATLGISAPTKGFEVSSSQRITGAADAVGYAAGADSILVGNADGDVYVAPLNVRGVRVVQEPHFDSTRRLARVELTDVAAKQLHVQRGDWYRACNVAELGVAADSVGSALKAMTMAVEHAKMRHQFGRAIGTFQGVSHRCAEMAFQIQGAWTLVWAAAEHLDSSDDHGSDRMDDAVSLAKAYASDAASAVTNSALQVHGGLGYSAECDSHLLLRRAMTNSHLWRSCREHRAHTAKRLLASSQRIL